MKLSILFILATASLAHAARRKPAVAASPAPTPVLSSTPVPASVLPSSPVPTPAPSSTVRALNPVQSNPPDPGDAFQPRTQSGCLSNIGIAQPTGGVYYHQGDSMTLVILADMFLPQSDTVADIIDASNNTVATLIPTFPVLNFTTATTAIPLPTAMTPGIYSVRFHQTYSNSFASGIRSQTMQLRMTVVPSGASTPVPPPTTSVNALGLTVVIPRATAAAMATSSPGASSAPGSVPGSTNGAATSTSSGSTYTAVTAPSTGSSYFNSFSFGITVMLGFVGFLAAL